LPGPGGAKQDEQDPEGQPARCPSPAERACRHGSFLLKERGVVNQEEDAREGKTCAPEGFA
jgi:hypothetical protein